MIRRRPDLIVPVRDRRQRKRYLTVKNVGLGLLAATALFVAITIRSEMRGRTPGEFGRLFGSEVANAVDPKPVEVVREAAPPPPVDDATHANPMLVEPAVRAQWLEGDAAAVPAATAAAPAPAPPLRSAPSEVVVVGGPGGVSVVKKDARPRPVLSGGFGR
ncbi:MAG TPA: hypothetical protein VND45_13985 [Thermoanaerobaculia bacterium]|nr:hypothetical protein [Thermoanaerobaculia bacterium]